jgi:hypothetical protein
MVEHPEAPVASPQTESLDSNGPYGRRSVKIFIAAILAVAIGFTLVTLLSGFRPRDAERAALAKEPGAIVYKVVEIEDGSLLYSFHISTVNGIHEVSVNLFSERSLRIR